MKNMFLYLTSRKYRQYHRIVRGTDFIKLDRGVGYYSLNRNVDEFELAMQSGNTAILTYISHVNFNDPFDMVKSSLYKFHGYKGWTRVKDCTWDEFKELYSNLLVS